MLENGLEAGSSELSGDGTGGGSSRSARALNAALELRSLVETEKAETCWKDKEIGSRGGAETVGSFKLDHETEERDAGRGQHDAESELERGSGLIERVRID